MTVAVRELRFDEMPGFVGRELGVSEWFTVDQALIDGFAEVTGDRQWIHVDPVRAVDGPFGTTIAHGYLMLSLLPRLLRSAYRVGGVGLVVNYGLNRLRFPAPVPVGSRVRVVAQLQEFSPVGGTWQSVVRATIEIEDAPKPSCVAEIVTRLTPA